MGLENYNLSNALNEIPCDTTFTIKDINSVSWDTMFISKPYNYESIKEKNINMPSDINQKFKNISMEEGSCILIFVKNHTLVNYSIIPRISTVDFAFIDSLNLGLPSNTKLKITRDSILNRKIVMSFY